MTVKLEKVLAFDWYRHQILVWPIATLRNELSANQKGVFSLRSHAETGFKRKRGRKQASRESTTLLRQLSIECLPANHIV